MTKTHTSIKALSGDVSFIETVASEGFRGFVHSVFDKAVNLRRLSDDGLYTLVNRRLDNGPDTLVLDIDTFSDRGIETGLLVDSVPGGFRIGETMVVSLAGARPWSGVLRSYPSDDTPLKAALARAKRRLSPHVDCLSRQADPFTRVTFQRLEASGRALLGCLARGEGDGARGHAARLIGLGPGLTPAGDDFLVGLAASLHIDGHPQAGLRVMFQEIALLSSKSTNEISYFFLKKAAFGKIREKIIGFINSVQSKNRKEFDRNFDEVVAIGSSSGVFILKGIIGGLEMTVKNDEVKSWH